MWNVMSTELGEGGWGGARSSSTVANVHGCWTLIELKGQYVCFLEAENTFPHQFPITVLSPDMLLMKEDDTHKLPANQK